MGSRGNRHTHCRGSFIYRDDLRISLPQRARQFWAMGQPTATLVLEEASFSLSSGIGSSVLQWSAITEVWRFRGFWLVLFSKSQFVTLPLVSLSEEAQAFILSRVEASGGKTSG